MNRDVSTWILALGGVVAAFGALRVYSVIFADSAAKADITSADGGIGLIAVVIGLALIGVGWYLRRSKMAA